MRSPALLTLYLHVPYCRALCHYCDFAKTANFSQEHTDAYFSGLLSHVNLWKRWLDEPQFASVFLGGGTPSLFQKEWRPIFDTLRGNIAPGAEITLETNPDDVTGEALEAWRDLGINRLSLGIQTFEPRGLSVMKRTHTEDGARAAVTEARNVIGNVNFDLIYGWPGQTFADWKRDLRTAIDLSPDHLSLYVLTFESRTPLGRSYLRGKVQAQPDEALYTWYLHARDVLEAAGYEHGEVSNFAKPDRLSSHNRHYWRHGYYVGVGTGAHGFLPWGEWGRRFAYHRSDRAFLKHALSPELELGQGLDELGDWETERTRETWLDEFVVTGLRTAEGIDLHRAAAEAQAEFVPTGFVADALAKGDLSLGSDHHLRLAPTEWFREGTWAQLVRECLR